MFKAIFEKISARPVVFWGLVTQFATSIIALGMLFGWWNITQEQLGGILLVIGILGAFLAFFVQGQVTPLVDPRNEENQILTP